MRASAVVTDTRLPQVVRQSLNVESGLNDGICVPLLLIRRYQAEPAWATGLTTRRCLALAAGRPGCGSLLRRKEPGASSRRYSQGMAQNIQDWLAGFAAEIGTVPPTREELDMLLELAGIAAHASERPAAPITCWLVGRAGLAPRAALAAGKRLAAGSEANGS